MSIKGNTPVNIRGRFRDSRRIKESRLGVDTSFLAAILRLDTSHHALLNIAFISRATR